MRSPITQKELVPRNLDSLRPDGTRSRPPDGFFDDEIAENLEYGHIADQRAYADALREFLEQRAYFPPVTRLVAGNDGTTRIDPLFDLSGRGVVDRRG